MIATELSSDAMVGADEPQPRIREKRGWGHNQQEEEEVLEVLPMA
jgi:hypothetical protein